MGCGEIGSEAEWGVGGRGGGEIEWCAGSLGPRGALGTFVDGAGEGGRVEAGFAEGVEVGGGGGDVRI